MVRRAPRACHSRRCHRGRVGSTVGSGASASRGEKRGDELRLQGRLVLLDRQEIVSSCRHHLLANLPLGQQRIGRHHPPGQRQVGQHLLGRRQLLPFARGAQLGQDHLGLMGIGATRCTPGMSSPWIPRTVLPSRATASVELTPVWTSHAPTACSKAATSKALNTRCNVATQGLLPAGTPRSSSRVGSSRRMACPHCAMAYKLRAPHRIAPTHTCSNTASGSGGCAGSQPRGRRGSGTVAKAAASVPGGASGADAITCLIVSSSPAEITPAHPLPYHSTRMVIRPCGGAVNGPPVLVRLSPWRYTGFNVGPAGCAGRP